MGNRDEGGFGGAAGNLTGLVGARQDGTMDGQEMECGWLAVRGAWVWGSVNQCMRKEGGR